MNKMRMQTQNENFDWEDCDELHEELIKMAWDFGPYTYWEITCRLDQGRQVRYGEEPHNLIRINPEDLQK